MHIYAITSTTGPGSGKSALAKKIQASYPFPGNVIRMRFSDPLMGLKDRITNEARLDYESWKVSYVVPGATGRDLMIGAGEGIRAHCGKDIFAKILVRRLEGLKGTDEVVVIDDLRKVAEVNALVRALGPSDKLTLVDIVSTRGGGNDTEFTSELLRSCHTCERVTVKKAHWEDDGEIEIHDLTPNAKVRPRMKIYEFFGGPGSGKTTTAAWVFAALKAEDVPCEFAREHAQQMIYSGQAEQLKDQFSVLAGQYRLYRNLADAGAEIVFSDSSLRFGQLYAPEQVDRLKLRPVVEELEKEFEIKRIYVKRVKPFQQQGRVTSEKESRAKDKEIADKCGPFDFTMTGDKLGMNQCLKWIRRDLKDTPEDILGGDNA